MNTQLANTARIYDDSDDRPAIFLGMTDADMDEVRQWLKSRAGLYAIQPGTLQAALYVHGVDLGLSQVCMGFSFALTGATGALALPHGWKDALGNEWRWDEVVFRSDNNSDEEYVVDALDIHEAPAADFAAFAQGLLDATVACGWAG